jgi:hypothetical protein
MTDNTDSTMNRRVLLRLVTSVPAIPVVAAFAASPARPAITDLSAVPAAGSSVASKIHRAMALVDYIRGDAWQTRLSDEDQDDFANEIGTEIYGLFREVADMPCVTLPDALAKVKACTEGDRYAGDSFHMDPSDAEAGFISDAYMDDVAAFLGRMVEAQS